MKSLYLFKIFSSSVLIILASYRVYSQDAVSKIVQAGNLSSVHRLSALGPCNTDAGTTTVTTSVSRSHPRILCSGDTIAIKSNDDYKLPVPFCSGCEAELMYL